MHRFMLWFVSFMLFAGTAHAQNMTPGADPGGATTPGSGTTYYVSWSDGNDNDPGTTEALAWKTTTKVNAATLGPGDTVLFKRGDTWTNSVFRVKNRQGTSGNPITFGAYGSTGARPKLQDHNDSADDEFMCGVAGCTPGAGAVAWVVLDRLHLDSGDPIKLRRVSNVTVQYSEISRASRTCLRVYDDSSDVLVQYNKIWDCGGYSTGGCGLDCPAGINGEGFYIGSSQGFDPSDLTHDVTLRSNEIMNTTDNMVDIKEKLVNIIIENNIIHSSTNNPVSSAAIVMGQGTGNPATGVYIRQNVLHTFKGDCMISPGGTARVANNLIYNVIEGHGIYLRNSSIDADIFHNTIYGILEAGKVPIQLNSGTVLSDIRHNLGPNTANNMTASNNLFVNAPANNFNLRAGSPAIDVAAVYGGTTGDILGVVRPQGVGSLVDYGAYEYTGGTATPLHLVFAPPPVNTPEDTTMLPVIVCAKDTTEVTDATFVAAISLSITTNPAGGTLTGGTGGAATAGCRTFAALSIDNDGVGYQLTAVTTGATSVVSPLFNITDVPTSPAYTASATRRVPVVQ